MHMSDKSASSHTKIFESDNVIESTLEFIEYLI